MSPVMQAEEKAMTQLFRQEKLHLAFLGQVTTSGDMPK
jgi:hypothetical protein